MIPSNINTSLPALFEIALAIPEIETVLEYPYKNAAPNKKKADE